MIPHSRSAVRSEKGGSYLWGWGDVVVDEQWARSAASFCNRSGKRPNCVILDDDRPVVVNVLPLSWCTTMGSLLEQTEEGRAAPPCHHRCF